MKSCQLGAARHHTSRVTTAIVCAALLGAAFLPETSTADSSQIKVAAPEDTIQTTTRGSWPPPTTNEPLQCNIVSEANPATGQCYPGYIWLSSVTGHSTSKCAPPPPDYQPGRFTIYDYSFANIAQNACAPVTWTRPRCEEYSAVHLFDAGVYLDLGRHFRDPVTMYGAAPACAHSVVSNAINMAWAHTILTPQYFDDAVRGFMAGMFGVSLAPWNPAILACSRTGGGTHYVGVCTAGNFYINSQCQSVPRNIVNGICGGARTGIADTLWGSSPISLQWGDVPVESVGSATMFPLGADDSPGWYLWRGSAATPLLVFDPSHAGKIHSATQLFGNHTFGGKQLASRDTSNIRTEWRDGYEALESLDRNHDRTISGSELDPLALWFDRNRDAIADAGEVVALTDTGVVSLAVGPTVRDDVAHTVSVTRGFERVVDGRRLTGRTVDWFALRHDQPSMLLNSWTGRASGSEGYPEGLGVDPAAPSGWMSSDFPTISPAGANPASAAAFSTPGGIWKWTIDDPRKGSGNDPVSGLLFFAIRGNEVGGVSLSHSTIRSKAGSDSQALIRFRAVEGTREPIASGGQQITFTLLGDEASRVNSEATMNAEGTILMGRTTETRKLGDGTADFTYRWKAERASDPQPLEAPTEKPIGGRVSTK